MKPNVNSSTRRRALAAIVGATGSIFALSLEAASGQSDSAKTSVDTNDARRTSLQQRIELPAKPGRVFDVLMNEKDFAEITGLSAKIDPTAGGAFKTFGGLIEGRNVELIPAQRIVQAWREASWEPGFYSLVHFEISEQNEKTVLMLDHTGFHEGDFGHLNPGWHERYWEPLKRYLTRPQSPQ